MLRALSPVWLTFVNFLIEVETPHNRVVPLFKLTQKASCFVFFFNLLLVKGGWSNFRWSDFLIAKWEKAKWELIIFLLMWCTSQSCASNYTVGLYRGSNRIIAESQSIINFCLQVVRHLVKGFKSLNFCPWNTWYYFIQLWEFRNSEDGIWKGPPVIMKKMIHRDKSLALLVGALWLLGLVSGYEEL